MFNIKRIKYLVPFIFTLSIITSSCTVSIRHDNGKHKGWYKNPKNPHHPRSNNPGHKKHKKKKHKGHHQMKYADVSLFKELD
ncbi:hypothetical protein K6119_01925 [Paracrocinitomix mangrovi]|uniref:hypothetical protein n=1 Tax=Paracrocinitomix mangrovi TaxID=2862509 RepID=UPI001C8DDA18|nr:hypothetical protein [Paracrocinitomix mangrovi]UKN02276.1 hypothetical protein K6119_01925 [Paracrocinitomix mangrovi]